MMKKKFIKYLEDGLASLIMPDELQSIFRSQASVQKGKMSSKLFRYG